MNENEFIEIKKKNPDHQTIVEVNGHQIGGDIFTIIAGPCRVESQEQIMETAMAIKKAGAHILRGGAYKPCTSPHYDWGREEPALIELKTAGEAAGLSVISEAMDLEQLKSVSQYSDIIQIGTRNSQNYNFLKELGNYSNPVMLKRGTWMDLRETLCSAEWVYFSDETRGVKGNKNLIMCERGTVHFNDHMRWTLDFSIIPSFKQISHIPIIVDISHGTGGVGNTSYYKDLARAAVAVGADGLMVEVHPDPEKSQSDAAQTISLEDFAELVQYIKPVIEAVGKRI
ncbi:MAG: 3-deoxy-7-phosphoheptulonate synthase [Pseudomonadota bacterium]